MVTISHPDKVFRPDEGYTKGDVVHYYTSIYKYIIPYLKDRPQSLFRSVHGIKEKGFYQKDMGENAPTWATIYPMRSESAEKEVHYMVCNDKETLLHLVNRDCIEINPWNSRTMSPDHPDYMVFDLDPGEKTAFEDLIEAALVIKGLLDKAGADSYCKTSGATGLHIFVPLGAKYLYSDIRAFAELLAMKVVYTLPDTTTIERSLSKRGRKKIYIDYLQNKIGATLVSAYSVRPRAGATVSTPLEWSEVKPGLNPKDFHIGNTLDRIKEKGDLFAGVLGKGIDLEKCIEKIGN